MKTFLELLESKVQPADDLLRLANVWRLAGNNVGAATITDSTPSLSNLKKLSAAREQCERLIALLPESAREHSLLWCHSELIDAIHFYQDNSEDFLASLQPELDLKV